MKKILYLFLILPLVFSSCKKEDEKVQGCTDSAASNYNSNAEENDGSCLFDGCTDLLATNYDPAANNDDGSCEYSIIASWDLDQIWIDNQDVTGSFFELEYTFYNDNSTYYEFSLADGNGNVLTDYGSEVWALSGSTITCVDIVDGDIAIWTVDHINGTQLHMSAILDGSLWDIHLKK